MAFILYKKNDIELLRPGGKASPCNGVALSVVLSFAFCEKTQEVDYRFEDYALHG